MSHSVVFTNPPNAPITILVECAVTQKLKEIWTLYEAVRKAHDAHVNNEPCALCSEPDHR